MEALEDVDQLDMEDKVDKPFGKPVITHARKVLDAECLEDALHLVFIPSRQQHGCRRLLVKLEDVQQFYDPCLLGVLGNLVLGQLLFQEPEAA